MRLAEASLARSLDPRPPPYASAYFGYERRKSPKKPPFFPRRFRPDSLNGSFMERTVQQLLSPRST